jgi:hypothetical protein
MRERKRERERERVRARNGCRGALDGGVRGGAGRGGEGKKMDGSSADGEETRPWGSRESAVAERGGDQCRKSVCPYLRVA